MRDFNEISCAGIDVPPDDDTDALALHSLIPVYVVAFPVVVIRLVLSCISEVVRQCPRRAA